MKLGRGNRYPATFRCSRSSLKIIRTVKIIVPPIFKANCQYTVLKYMSKKDLSRRSSRHSLSEAIHMQNRHQSTAPSSKDDNYTQPTQLSWEGCDPLPTPHTPMDSASSRCSNTFKPFDFEMFVRDPHQKPPRHVHTFTKLPKGPKLQVIQIDNVRQWRKDRKSVV